MPSGPSALLKFRLARIFSTPCVVTMIITEAVCLLLYHQAWGSYGWTFDLGSKDSSVVRTSDSWLKGSRLKSLQEQWEIFFSRVHLQCWLLVLFWYSTPVLPQWQAKDPSYSTRSTGSRLQLNMHAPYPCAFEWSDTVIWCMVEWCTENLRRDSSSFMWHQPCNN